MRLPQGRLLKSRVVTDPREPLAEMLDRSVTGYAVFEPQDSLLLDADGRGVVTFTDGVPVVAYHTGTDRGGPPALADLAVPGPYHVSAFELDAADLAPVHDVEELCVPPGMPAERLAGDPALADSTRRAAPAGRPTAAGAESADDHGAVEAFLEDEEKISAIREQARQEAKQRAAEWGLNDT
ncbi:hypothetical protein [Haloarcula salinisoli]|uniref:DUF8054 domain-containing protein n=1 Tax=Haloarcula salinisoli TaxID=2487746 RepID=A0A8J7YB52_9EURY|nr:hypothetical protein [Halomicroarcula salinisoli]MBX0302212.1 hypothetical protein [Halomicroarcula salinisoli]